MNKKMYVFIINPIAGSGKGIKVWEQIKSHIEARADVHYRSFFTKHAGHAEDIAIQVAELHGEKLEAIVVIGGDGTIHEVVNGLRAYPHIPIGYIPGGSGNDFARGFAVPKIAKKAWQRIIQKKNRQLKRYDVGRFLFPERKKSDRLFMNGIGIGFDGDVAKVTNESGYKQILNKLECGSFAYAFSALRMLFTYKPCDLDMVIDGENYSFEEVWLVAISNIPYYGGGIQINPKAKPNDGKLNVCIVHQLNKWKLLAVFITVFFGQHHRFKEVTLLEGRTFQISSERPLTIHADGEIIGTTPIRVEVEEKAQLFI